MKKLYSLFFTLFLLSSAQASFREDLGLFESFVIKSDFIIASQIEPSEVAQIKNEIADKLSKNFIVKIVEENRINAYATLNEDDIPVVSITSKMLHHEFMNKNVLKLLICHELGHAYGGFPKQFRGRSELKSWSTAEGQADYYSALVCARKLKFEQTKKFYSICKDDQKCQSMVDAAVNLSKIYAEIKFWPYELSVSDPDRNIVHTTELTHPNPQCRLDTFINAIRCLKSTKASIEGKPFYTCTQSEARQPSCWMAPSTFQDI